jgi:monothiol glutaredoxin|tara:strand:+ start:842 stop:1315 length:474 start_codon:yes stop_codon:yes gene_type:complete
MMMATTTFTSSSSSPSIRSSSGAKTSISSSFNSTTSKKSSTTFSRRIRANLGPELKTQIDKCVTENKVVLFMKGTKSAPKCGFSNTCVQILQSMNVPFTDVDILASEQLRVGMKTYSSWPTFPQLYIGGEFFGGCDITMDAYKDGSLKEELERAMLE